MRRPPRAPESRAVVAGHGPGIPGDPLRQLGLVAIHNGDTIRLSPRGEALLGVEEGRGSPARAG